MWNLLTGPRSDKYMEEVGTNYKKHGGNPFPPQGLMGRYPDLSKPRGCKCQDWVISVRRLSDGRQNGQSVSTACLWERLVPAGSTPWKYNKQSDWTEEMDEDYGIKLKGMICFFFYTQKIYFYCLTRTFNNERKGIKGYLFVCFPVKIQISPINRGNYVETDLLTSEKLVA